MVRSLVSLSRHLVSETPRHRLLRRDGSETGAETADLKALAQRVLARDSDRDCNRDGASRDTHSTNRPAETADAWYLLSESTETLATNSDTEGASGFPHECVAGLAQLHPDRSPADVPLARWRQFLADGRQLLDDGIIALAIAAGWTAYDLFGCDNTKPFARTDQMGFIWFVKGGRVVSM